MSKNVFWSQEEYVVNNAPMIAGNRYIVREVNKDDTSIHVFNSELGQPELIVGHEGLGVSAQNMMWLLCPLHGPVV